MKAVTVQIKKRIDHIKANIHNMQNARAAIIEDLIYLSDHKQELKATTGKTFDEIVKELTGFSRRYLNQLVSNYKYLEQYGKLELFNTIDVKAIEHVKKTNRPDLLNEPEKLTRKGKLPGDGLPILDAEIIDPTCKTDRKQGLYAPDASQEGRKRASGQGAGVQIPGEITAAIQAVLSRLPETDRGIFIDSLIDWLLNKK